MENTLTQLGVGGVFVILALREVRGILAEVRNGKKNGNGNGNGHTSDPLIVEKLTTQTNVLNEIRDEQRRLSDGILKLMERRSVVRGGG